MDLRLTDEQDQLVDAFASLFGKHASPEHVRAAEQTGERSGGQSGGPAGGFDPALWARLGELGAVPMAVAEADGGWGADMVDLALVAEQHGRAVAPVPLIEAQVAARSLARLGASSAHQGSAVAADALAAVLAGDRLVTLAVRPADGDRATLVPAGAVADDALVLADGRLLLVPLDGHRTPVENLGSMPVADVVIGADAVVLADGDAAGRETDHALDEWLCLTASALVGIAARSLEIGVEYVKERHAFGVPIGSFQAVSHRLADVAAAADGARLLAQEAAWAVDEGLPRAAELGAMAFAFAAEAARDASYRSLHFHGGYGFMMEYDIQLYYRRARAWTNVYAEPELAYRRAGARRYATVEG